MDATFLKLSLVASFSSPLCCIFHKFPFIHDTRGKVLNLVEVESLEIEATQCPP